MWRPRERSTKKTSGSASEGEFNADCFFDLSALAVIVLGQLVNRFARLVALCHDACRDAPARYRGTTKGNIGVNDDYLRLIDIALAGEWIQADGQAIGVVLHTAQVRSEHFLHGQLAGLRYRDKLLEAGQEQVHPISLKFVIRQGVRNAKMLVHIIECGANLGQWDIMLAA